MQDKIILLTAELENPSITETQRANTLLNIISLKSKLNQKDIYPFKIKYLNSYINLYKENPLGYYDLEISQFKKILSDTDHKENMFLLSHLKIELKKSGYEEKDFLKINDLLNQTEFKYYYSNKTLKNIFKLILKGITYNYWITLLSIFIIILIMSLMLLPALNVSFIAFEYSSVNYTGIKLIDNFFNSITYLLSIDSKTSLKPINLLGVVILIFYKILFWGIILKLLTEKLNKKIS